MADKNEDGSVDEITACPDCKGTHLKRDYDHAEIVCADCGLVLEDNIVDTGPAVSYTHLTLPTIYSV